MKGNFFEKKKDNYHVIIGGLFYPIRISRHIRRCEIRSSLAILPVNFKHGYSVLGYYKKTKFQYFSNWKYSSCVASILCVIAFRTEEWGWYFKPFTSIGLALVISAAAFIVQIIIWLINTKKAALNDQEGERK